MSNNEKVPGYVAFAKALAQKFEELNIPLVPVTVEDAPDGLRGPADWVCFEVQGTGDKVYCNRLAGGDPSKIETTVPFESIPAEVRAEDMRGRNGKIEARVKADIGLLTQHLLPVMAKRVQDGERIRANRRPVG